MDGMGAIFVMVFIIWLIISLMSKLAVKQEKLLSKSDTKKDEEVAAATIETVMAYQGNGNHFIIRKIIEKSKAEERLITPTGPIVNRKY